jgi:hypothetical protein
LNTIPVNAVGESYESRSRPLSAQKTLNFYPEINPDSTALHCWYGAKLFSTGIGANRGIYEWNSALYAVNGTSLVKVASNGAQTAIGTITGIERCVFAADGNYLYIVASSNVYRTDGTTVTQSTDTDLSEPNSIAFLNGFFLYDDGDY